MEIVVNVENIRCGGCANTITQKLTSLDGIQSVAIDIEGQCVTVEADVESRREAVVERLLSLGYPEQGSVEGLEALKGKAKSVVSCAVGKMS